MTDYMNALDKILAGDGVALLTMREWLAFNPEMAFGESSIEDDARKMGMTSEALLASADRATVAVQAQVFKSLDKAPCITIRAYAYEIADAPQQGMTP